MIPPNAILFISDLHLSPHAPVLQDLFQQFLKGPAKGAKQLYILGDLFDMWIGEDIQASHQEEVAGLLRDLANNGTEIFFLGGNRDFLVSASFLKKAHCRKLTDPSIISLHGIPTLLTHGDLLCTQDVAYQRYRRIAQHPLMRFVVLHLPFFIRKKLALKLRSKSKIHQAQQAPEILDVAPIAVTQMMQQWSVTQLIHGHVHRPKIHPEQNVAPVAKRYVLGDWGKTASFLMSTPEGIILSTYSPEEGVQTIADNIY